MVAIMQNQGTVFIDNSLHSTHGHRRMGSHQAFAIAIGTAHAPLAHEERYLASSHEHSADPCRSDGLLTDQTTKAVRPTGTAFFEEVWGPPPGVVIASNASPVVYKAQGPV